MLGLKPREDVTILSIGGQGERMAALEAGSVVGTLVNPPETTMARQRGYHALLDMSKMNMLDAHTSTIVSREYLEDHRDVVESFLKATAEAVWLLKSNKAEAIARLSRYLDLDPVKDAAALEETYEVIIRQNFADIPYPSLAAIRELITEAAVDNPAVAGLNPEDFTDVSFAQEMERSGFLKELASSPE
jgi:ABC-type nitrate/sulfonate/bicarbonate transport system substrate-binding protein